MVETTSRHILVENFGFQQRYAFIESGKLQDFYVQRDGPSWGDIYYCCVLSKHAHLAHVRVSLGQGYEGFLPQALCLGKKLPQEGEKLWVQVTKAAFQGKRAKVTARPSLEGSAVVFRPFISGCVMAKDHGLQGHGRDQLLSVLHRVKEESWPKGGFAMRQHGKNITLKSLENQARNLISDWRDMVLNPPLKPMRMALGISLAEKKMIQWFDDAQICSLTVQGNIYDMVNRIEHILPSAVKDLKPFHQSIPLFEAFGIEEDIQALGESYVPLSHKAGLTIEQTQAMVCIDVDSGSGQYGQDPMKMIKEINIQASHEAARQIRLRQLSGIIMVDLLRCQNKEQARDLLAIWKELFSHEPETVIHGWTKGGVLELSRSRRSPPWIQKNISQDIVHQAFDLCVSLLHHARAQPQTKWRLCISRQLHAALDQQAQKAWHEVMNQLGYQPEIVIHHHEKLCHTFEPVDALS